MDFGDDFGFGSFGFGNHQAMRKKGSTVTGTVNITLEDVLNGVDKTVRYSRKKVCHSCHGTGMDSNSREEQCTHCHGRGFINQGFGNMSIHTTCPYCGGNGKIVINPCRTCGGAGLETETVEKTFKIPPGVSNGMVFNLEGLGNEIPGKGNIPGDLHIIVNELKHPVFKREGYDLVMNINVGVIDAILGTKVRITTLNGKKLDLTIPGGSEYGKILMLNGFGLPRYGIGGYGNLACVIHLVMPKSLSGKERKALEKLSKSENFTK
jgi:molecular chaperone DnaJ